MINKNSIAFFVLCATAASVSAQQTASATFDSKFQPAVQNMEPVAKQAHKKAPLAVNKNNTKKIRDPLAIHSDASIKDTKAKEIVLPGVMTIKGENAHALDFTKARVIQVTNGTTEAVYLSAEYPNRIQLPWPNVRIIGMEGVEIRPSKTSNNMYVQFDEGVNKPVQVYFENKSGSKAVLSLQLIPKSIPGQTILVQDNTPLQGESIVAPKSNDYVANTQYLLEVVALGGTPQGYSRMDLDVPPIIMSGLVVKPKRLYTTSDRDIYEYDVVNPNENKAVISEQEFDGDSVLAVSIFPKPILAKNEQTRVIVIARKRKGT